MHVARRPLLVNDLQSTTLWTPPRPGIIRARTHDSMVTLDQKTIDSAGAFFIGELERLDPTMHDPLVAVFWNRDIELREDVTIADELSSWTINSYAAPGSISPSGKAWVGKDTNAITNIALDIGKLSNPLFLWAMTLDYTIPELASAQKLGRPIDQAKFAGLKLKHQMDIDEQVYIGDSVLGYTGLLNNPSVDTATVANGASASPLWSSKTPDEILTDVNSVLTTAWSNSGWTVAPTEIRLPPNKFSYIVNTKVSNAGNNSILTYLMENNISKTQMGGGNINIQPLKWLTGRGAGSSDRMIAYTKNKEYVRFPMTPLQRTNPEQRALSQITTYYCRLGVVEFVYPETVAYRDGF